MSRVIWSAHEKGPHCGWAAGATTEVVLECDARALQMSQLAPGEMRSSFMAWQDLRRQRSAVGHMKLE